MRISGAISVVAINWWRGDILRKTWWKLNQQMCRLLWRSRNTYRNNQIIQPHYWNFIVVWLTARKNLDTWKQFIIEANMYVPPTKYSQAWLSFSFRTSPILGWFFAQQWWRWVRCQHNQRANMFSSSRYLSHRAAALSELPVTEEYVPYRPEFECGHRLANHFSTVFLAAWCEWSSTLNRN